MIVAIDGPSGAGKSSVAREAALDLAFNCLDTGAMYRAVADEAVRRGVALDDSEALGAIAREALITFDHEEGNPVATGVKIDGRDVTRAIRTAEIDRAVSPVSATPSVREALVAQQRRIADTGNFVVEGRDIATVVFPDAEVKVFLTASAEERARRRVKQNIERGVGLTDFDAVLADIERRDEYDSSRATSPLKPAADALILDSTALSIEQVVQEICNLVRARENSRDK